MIRCIAIDDEPLALKQIVIYITQTPHLELEGQFESALQAIEYLQSHEVDLMFVDINMVRRRQVGLDNSIKKLGGV